MNAGRLLLAFVVALCFGTVTILARTLEQHLAGAPA